MNHGADRHIIVFRTAPGTKLLALTIHRRVLFDVDGVDDDEAFSVVVKSDADEFEGEVEVEEAERLGVSPWAPGEKKRWVRVTPRDIQGRAFKLQRQSEPSGIGAIAHP